MFMTSIVNRKNTTQAKAAGVKINHQDTRKMDETRKVSKKMDKEEGGGSRRVAKGTVKEEGAEEAYYR
jgi:hypothetical protein